MTTATLEQIAARMQTRIAKGGLTAKNTGVLEDWSQSLLEWHDDDHTPDEDQMAALKTLLAQLDELDRRDAPAPAPAPAGGPKAPGKGKVPAKAAVAASARSGEPAVDLEPARQLHGAGIKLCALHPDTKRPVGNGWNTAANCAQAIDDSATGYGIPLAINGRCSIDPDQVDMARIVIAAWGFDYEDLMASGVRTVSTRPGSGGRSMFAARDDLGWVKFRAKIAGVNVTVLELRAGSANLQDVVPGLIYKDAAGNTCTQSYANGRTFLEMPALPDDFGAFWARMTGDPAYRARMEDKANEALRAAGHAIEAIRDLSGTAAGSLPFGGEVHGRLRSAFNEMFTGESILAKHGYTEHLSKRWSAPGSTGEPGIRKIKGHESLWQSDHGSDPLQGTFDAAAASITLDFKYDTDAFSAWARGASALADFGNAEAALPTEDEVRREVQRASEVTSATPPPQGFTLRSYFVDHTLTTKDTEKMDSTRFIYKNLIPQGLITVYPSPANGGKTAIFTHAACKLADEGFEVFYINADASPSQLKDQQVKAGKHGFNILAPDAKDAGGVRGLLDRLTALSKMDVSLTKLVLVVDVLKKFVDMLSKGELKAFINLTRKLVAKGGTVCLLAHTNKYLSSEGKLVYEGTADLRNDIDNMIYLYSSLAAPGLREVTSSPDKTRTTFEPISFRIRFGAFGVAVEELDEVLPCFTDELRQVFTAAAAGIEAGTRGQETLVQYVAEELMLGVNKSREKLKLLCDLNNSPLIRRRFEGGNGFVFDLRGKGPQPYTDF